jgi:hypothetical protein
MDTKVTEACSNGKTTTLSLYTTADLAYWGLKPTDFDPLGSAYLEAAIVFMENGHLFSGSSSGGREGVHYDPLQNTIGVEQWFVFLAVPTPGAKYSLKAEATLGSLPKQYHPPLGLPPVAIIDPATVVVPVQSNLPVTIVPCH